MNENKNQNTEQEVSAIKKLIAKLHTAKIAKKLVSLALVASLTTGFTACDKENSSNSNSTISETNNNSSNQTNAEYGEHSELLQNVLNNPEYDSLIARASNGDTNLLNSPYFHGHPYGFLEDEGYDVESIKKGKIETYSISYVLDEEPNNLYVHTRILENNSVYAHYLLKYTLTDLEMKDYNLMHTGVSINCNYYVQCAFMNDMISQMKTPEIVSESRIEKSCFESMTEHLQKFGFEISKNVQFIFTNFEAENKKFDIFVYPKYYTESFVNAKGGIVSINCEPRYVSAKNDVYTAPTKFNHVITSNEQTKSVKYYLVQDNNFLISRDFEKLN